MAFCARPSGLIKEKRNKKTIQAENSVTADSKGYAGTLPDLSREFEYLKDIPLPPGSENIYTTDLDEQRLSKIPVQNSKYVEIILRQHNPSEYLLDVREMIMLLEKLKMTINTTKKLQFFNAQTGSLIHQVNYLQEKYHDKEQALRPEYQKMIDFSNKAREIAIVSAQAEIYKKYIPTSETQYSPSAISFSMDALLPQLDEILILLKEVR